MPPTLRSGQVATNEVLQAQLVVDMGTDVFGYDPPGAPMMRFFTKRMGSKKARATRVAWMEDEPVPYWDRLNEPLDNSETTVTVDNGPYFQAGNLVKVVSTNEVMRVTGVAGNDLTVTRGYIGTATAADDDSYIINLSTAETEGDTSPAAISTVKVERFNYTQIVKTPVHLTETNRAVEHYHGDEFTYLQRKAGEAHARRWEEIALHGRKNEDLSTAAHPIRAAGGIDEIISSNVLDGSAILTESEFRTWLGQCFRFSVNPGRRTKLVMAGQNFINLINSWGQDKLQLNKAAKQTYGMDVVTYVSGFGKLEIVYHPLLENGYQDTAYLVDPDGVMYRPLRGTKLEQNIQAPDEDGRKDQYKTEATFQFALEKVHGKITGLAA